MAIGEGVPSREDGTREDVVMLFFSKHRLYNCVNAPEFYTPHLVRVLYHTYCKGTYCKGYAFIVRIS